MDERSEIGGKYRYSFQGQEGDSEIKGEGNSINYKYRMHDPRVGRFFAVDPLASIYPYNGGYNFSENRGIDGVELEGLEFAKNWTWDVFSTSMQELKKDPISINQGGAGTCVVTAITYIWLQTDKASFHSAMMSLYVTKEAQVNNFKIKPNESIFEVKPNAPNISSDGYGTPTEIGADWMAISSIQSSLDATFTGLSTDNTAVGRKEVKYLMKNLLGFDKVYEKYYYGIARDDMDPKGVLKRLEANIKNGYSVTIGINPNLINDGAYPENSGHRVNFLGNVKDLGNGYFSFDIQSWGKKINVTVTEEQFKKYYNGATWGKDSETE